MAGQYFLNDVTKLKYTRKTRWFQRDVSFVPREVRIKLFML
jgi:hypothetical protein